MRNDIDVHVSNFIELMNRFLMGQVRADEYCTAYFDMSKKRFIVTEEESIVLQKAFGDADDYDEVVRGPYIGEPELKARVRKSLEQLAALGHTLPTQRKQ